MKLFSKRETLTQNIAYMALMAAINVSFVLLTTLVPFLFFIIVFLLPLTSTVVILFCKKRYFPIYAFATVGLCMIVTMWNISDTIFYVIPSIFSGLIFGIIVDKKIHTSWLILIASIVQTLISFLMIPLTKLIVGINIVDTFLSVFSLSEFIYKDYLVPPFILFLSLGQITISYMIIKDEIKKMGIEINQSFSKLDVLLSMIVFIVLIGLIILLVFTLPSVTYLILGLMIYIGLNLVFYYGIRLKYVGVAAIFAGIFIFILVFAALYQHVETPFQLLLISLFFIIETTILFITNLIKNQIQKSRNKKSL